MTVTKTSVYLSDDEVARLAELAKREGTSQADIIRRAIGQYRPEAAGDRDFALARIAAGPEGSIADVPEHLQLAGFGS